MNGIIIINKPADFTSFDVVAKLRGILKERRIGHSGTLDPMATGVLPIFIGSATKIINFIPDSSKEYLASFKLGLTTNTQDITGEILSQTDVNSVAYNDLKYTVDKFIGDIKQIPPMFSAVKINGKRLYKLARQGVTVERKPRSVNIKSIDIIEFNGIEGVLKVSCSKGCYIRTLVHDIGEILKCGGVLTALERTRAGCFKLKDSVDLLNFPSPVSLLPIDTPLLEYNKIILNEAQKTMFQNGVKLDIKRIPSLKSTNYESIFRFYSKDDLFIGLAKPNGDKLEILKLIRDYCSLD